MAKYASKMVELAQSWVGIKEGSTGHKEILAIYNSQKPLPRGYKMTTKDAWCAATTTALAVKLGYTDIVPCECSCSKLIAIAKEMGIWIEDESITPKPGMLCVYDWGDSGKGDNKGDPDHIGIVESVGGGEFIVIEGNADTNKDGKDGVERRPLSVNGRNLRGFIAPKYDAETATVKVYKPSVKEWQLAAIADGYKFPKYGADGKWGAECESVAKKAVVKKRVFYTNKNLTKIVQRVVGVTADGKCGKDTDAAIRKYQQTNGLSVDGAVGLNTWKKILGVK